jgi:hypothetical protein
VEIETRVRIDLAWCGVVCLLCYDTAGSLYPAIPVRISRVVVLADDDDDDDQERYHDIADPLIMWLNCLVSIQ